jgi:hypothetical protein
MVVLTMRPSTRTALGLLTMSTTAATSMAACLDATPVEVPVATIDTSQHPPTVIDDASLEGSADAVPAETCESCLGTAGHLGPGCPDVVTACENNPTCSNAYHCAIRVGCLSSPSTDLFISCGLSCANEAGLIDYSDPAFLQMYAIFTCAAAHCGQYCLFAKGTDAAIH